MDLDLDTDDVGGRDTSRLEAFSDGVIAIAITLLIIEIRPPHLDAGHDGPINLVRALRGLWPNYLGYLISFLTIGVMWINHHNVFRLIVRTDQTLVVLNTLLLLCIAFLPFPTAVVAESIGSDAERAAVVFYGACFTVTAVFFSLIWWYPTRDRRLVDRRVDPRTLASISRRFLVGAPIYLLATLIGLLSAGLSLAIFLLLAVYYILPGTSTARRS